MPLPVAATKDDDQMINTRYELPLIGHRLLTVSTDKRTKNID